MDSSSPRVQCQATLALRNLASDALYQLEIVRAGGLANLVTLLKSQHEPLVLAAVACIRNISIHPMNEGLIIEAGFLKPLVALVDYTDSVEIQCHAVSTLRNLAASSEKNRLALLDAGAVKKCRDLVLTSPESVQSEISACFAILALAEELKTRLLEQGIMDVLIPLTKSPNPEVCGNSAAALANLCSRINDYSIVLMKYAEISDFISSFLSSGNSTFEHIALWTMLQLLESNDQDIKIRIKKEIHTGKMNLNNLTADDNFTNGTDEIANLTQQILELIK
ncbi:unnamed protein product [Ambrosiozyma monospora]|uniref:Unnamed protein product n=1 Tax=Ambrosiozyma monospora TaxID=43982 RepID=A0ACB5TWD1_AMBMO|nr:unnamed protein product [Ambrosiozyma monospora]